MLREARAEWEVVREIRSVLVQLRRSPAFVLLSVAVLALGLGATTATFVVLESVVLHPLPYPNADRMVVLWKTSPQFGRSLSMDPTPEEAARWRETANSFEQIEIESHRSMLHRAEGRPAEAWSTLQVSPDFLRFLEIEPAAGRMFDTTEVDDDVALIDYQRYVRDFGADPSTLGKSIVLDGSLVTVIGVLPPRFRRPSGFPGRVDAILPRSADERGSVVARLAPRVDIEDAERELDFLLAQATPDEEGASSSSADEIWESRVVRPREMAGGRTAEILWTLMAAMFIVLLLACTNVASMFLTRCLARRRMLAIRHALGASRRDLALPLVLEATVIAGVAALAAWWVAQAELALVDRLRPDSLDYLDAVTASSRVPLFVFSITLAALALYGVLPAARVAASVDLDYLRQGNTGGDPSSQRIRSLLVVAQVALCFVLLATGLLLSQHLRTLSDVDLGYRTEGVVAATIRLPEWRLQDPEAISDAQSGLIDGLREWPITSDLVRSGNVPTRFGILVGDLQIEGGGPALEGGFLWANRIEAGYFRLLGQPLVVGGLWQERQKDVCIINEAMARTHFGSAASAVGRRIRQGQSSMEIVGVAGNVRTNGPGSDPEAPQIYLPYVAYGTDLTVLFSAGDLDEPTLLTELRARVDRIEPDALVEEVSTLERLVADHLAQHRFVLSLLGAFSLLGLVLASLGVLGLCGEWVRRHRRELGIRGALGAGPGELARAVLSRGLRLTTFGIAAGALAMLALTRLLSTQLFGSERWDSTALILATAILAASTLPALFLPAVRAARLDPATVLREE